MKGPGHNSVGGEELLQLIERWEQLNIEKREIAMVQNEVMAEARGRGYDTKVIRKLNLRNFTLFNVQMFPSFDKLQKFLACN